MFTGPEVASFIKTDLPAFKVIMAASTGIGKSVVPIFEPAISTTVPAAITAFPSAAFIEPVVCSAKMLAGVSVDGAVRTMFPVFLMNALWPVNTAMSLVCVLIEAVAMPIPNVWSPAGPSLSRMESATSIPGFEPDS